MKVILINGSPHEHGNTFIALSEVAKTLNAEGIETEIIPLGNKAVRGCVACGKCREMGHCVFNDEPYATLREKLPAADAVVIGSPVYFAGPNGSLCALLDRLFFSLGHLVAYKPAASVAVYYKPRVVGAGLYEDEFCSAVTYCRIADGFVAFVEQLDECSRFYPFCLYV